MRVLYFFTFAVTAWALPHLSERGIGELGKDAFAGSGSPAKSITALQYLLQNQGYTVAVDGVWGAETSGTVATWQGRAGLDADAIPGPATLGSLVEQISKGATGSVVKAAQTLLGADVDGDYGQKTSDAATAYQSSNHLAADGIIGKDTWTALFTPGTKSFTKPPSTPGSDIPSGVIPKVVKDGQATLLSEAETNALLDPMRYAAAAYCAPASWKDWSCKNCKASFTKFYASGGGVIEGNFDVPNWFVIGNGDTVVVSIEGSTLGKPGPLDQWAGTWTNNLNAFADSDDDHLFPGRSDDIKIHRGFYYNLRNMAKPMKEAVSRALPANGNKVLVVGHSQGGAVATLVAVYLKKQLSATVTLRAFGAPRSGNSKWANYVDDVLGSYGQHYINYDDLVPSLPPQEVIPFTGGLYGWRHSSGEIWKTPEGPLVLCKGQENPGCFDSVKDHNIGSHTGNYPGGVGLGAC